MNTSESFQALRRANPRARDGFARSVESAAEALHAQVVAAAADVAVDAGGPGVPARRPAPRRRLVRVSAVGVFTVPKVSRCTMFTEVAPAASCAFEKA
jgi:hypothetical protein